MSFVYEFSKRARVKFRQLDFWLQEESLDELELLVAGPPPSTARARTGFVLDVVRVRRVSTYYVFLTIKTNVSARRFRVVDVGVFVRQ